jgi:hypothetical protein
LSKGYPFEKFQFFRKFPKNQKTWEIVQNAHKTKNFWKFSTFNFPSNFPKIFGFVRISEGLQRFLIFRKIWNFFLLNLTWPIPIRTRLRRTVYFTQSQPYTVCEATGICCTRCVFHQVSAWLRLWLTRSPRHSSCASRVSAWCGVCISLYMLDAVSASPDLCFPFSVTHHVFASLCLSHTSLLVSVCASPGLCRTRSFNRRPGRCRLTEGTYPAESEAGRPRFPKRKGAEVTGSKFLSRISKICSYLCVSCHLQPFSIFSKFRKFQIFRKFAKNQKT